MKKKWSIFSSSKALWSRCLAQYLSTRRIMIISGLDFSCNGPHSTVIFFLLSRHLTWSEFIHSKLNMNYMIKCKTKNKYWPRFQDCLWMVWELTLWGEHCKHSAELHYMHAHCWKQSTEIFNEKTKHSIKSSSLKLAKANDEWQRSLLILFA